MKQFLIIGLFAFVSGIFVSVFQIDAAAQTQLKATKDSTEPKKKAFVLLELFTSEGCPTCPPADANLAFLEREQPFAGTEIVTLALHIDYLNSVVWKDLYSSPTYSRRQQLYSQALKIGATYTPQMIVDGQTAFTGNNLAKAQKAILEAAKSLKATIEIIPTADNFTIKISDVPAHQNATVFLAITEDRLASNRKGGAKSDKNPEHISVVRSLSSLGNLTAAQTSLEIETALQIQPEWKKENLKIVVFIQENASRKVLGASRKSLL